MTLEVPMTLAQAEAHIDQLMRAYGDDEQERAWNTIKPWLYGGNGMRDDVRRQQWLDTFNAFVSSANWSDGESKMEHAAKWATKVHGFKPEGVP